MTRAAAARMLAEVIGVGVVGVLCDELADPVTRDLLMKIQIRCRELAADEAAAEQLKLSDQNGQMREASGVAQENRGGQISPWVCVSMGRRA